MHAFVADVTGRTVRLPTGASDAALAPYHVDRSKLFVVERFDGIEGLDAARIARAIEYTRFPYVPSQAEEEDDLTEEEGLLLRAADLIGQLGDPNYMRKANALFYEFEETGMNKTLGYDTPADIIYKYPQFYWTHVAPQVQASHQLSQCDLERTAMDCQSLQQRVSRRARGQSVGPANAAAAMRPMDSSRIPSWLRMVVVQAQNGALRYLTIRAEMDEVVGPVMTSCENYERQGREDSQYLEKLASVGHRDVEAMA